MSQKSHAESLADLGFYLFPVEPGGKTPLVRWSTMSVFSLAEVTAWWEEFPEDNIGINCGESGIIVVDLDSVVARDDFAQLWLEKEEADLRKARMPVIKTRRGWHLYFDQPLDGVRLGNTASKLAPGIDTRGKGGMVVAPGSVVSGFEYRVLTGDLGKLPRLPEWLQEMLTPKRPVMDMKELRRRKRLRWPKLAHAELQRRCQLIVHAPDGEQNTRIHQAAFFLGLECVPPLDPEDVRAALEEAADTGNHPPERSRPTIDSGLRAGLSAAAAEEDE